MFRRLLFAPLVAFCAILGGCHRAASPATSAVVPVSPAGAIDARRLAAADTEPGQWLTTGRDQAVDYHSMLRQINATNVSQLGFAWEYKLGSRRGLEATPVMVDGT